MDLITDRTEADVEQLKSLASKGWSGMSADEQAEFLRYASKGAYNVSDLNRVERAVRELSETFISLGYAAHMKTKTDWTDAYIPTPADLGRYLANVRTLRAMLPLPPGTPEVPATMSGMTWREANDIEEILFNIERIIGLMTQWQFYCGELYLGEVLN